MLPLLFLPEEKLNASGNCGSPILPLLFVAPYFTALCLLALVLFNRRDDWHDFKNYEKQVKEWEEKGLLETRLYRARRAFSVEEWEDEGSHYFLELENGGTLYLNGQYLYEYEPIHEEKYPEENQPRRFPCTEFAIRFHREKKFFVDIKCGGEVFEPELTARRPFTRKDYRNGVIPEDGQLIVDRSYDDLKTYFAASTRAVNV